MMEQEQTLRAIGCEVRLVVVDWNTAAIDISVKRQARKSTRHVEARIGRVVRVRRKTIDRPAEAAALRDDAIVELRVRSRQTECRSIDGNDHDVAVVDHRVEVQLSRSSRRSRGSA